MPLNRTAQLETSEERSTNWNDARVRPFRIYAAITGMYSGSKFEPRVKSRTLLLYQILMNVLLTVSFIITIGFGFSAGEAFGPQLTFRVLMILYGFRAVMVNWYLVWLSRYKKLLKIHNRQIEKCVYALKNFGIDLSYKIDLHQWVLLGIAVFIHLFNTGWIILALILTNENEPSNAQLEQRVANPDLRSAVVIFRDIMQFLASNSITLITASVMNSMHLPVLLFKAFNLKVKQLIQTSEILMVEDLRRIRLIHNELCDMLDLSNHYWKYILAVDLTTMISMVLLNLFTLAGILGGQHSASANSILVIIIWILMLSIILGLIIYHADKAYCQTDELLNTLQSLQYSEVDSKMVLEVQLFISKLQKPSGYTAAGMLAITRELGLTIFSFVVTYFIVMVQFSSVQPSDATELSSIPATNFTTIIAE